MNQRRPTGPEGAVEAILDHARAVFDRWGVPEAMETLRVERTATGRVEIVRPVTVLGRLKQFEGNTVAVTVDPVGDGIDPRDWPKVERMVARHVRRHLREIALAGADPEPMWSYTIHNLAAGWLASRDVDPHYLVEFLRNGRAGENAFDDYAGKRGVSVSKLVVEDGRIDFSIITNGGYPQITGSAPRVGFLILGQYPETVAQAAAGRRLGEVVDHPAVRLAKPQRVVLADADPSMALLTLAVEDHQVPLERIPAGRDRRWLKAPFLPHWE